MNLAKKAIATLAAFTLLVAGCGGEDAGSSTTATSTTTAAAPATSSTVITTTAATTTAAPTTTTTTAAPVTTTATSTTTAASTTTTLAGEPIELFAREGDVLGVVGVAHDDVLNVRAGPGTDQPVVATLDPLADDVIATGRARQLPRSLWYEVDVDGVTGWASIAFLAYIGDTFDSTDEAIATLGTGPIAETMVDVGRIVAETFASADPVSEITMTAPPTGSDTAEVTYDVIGLGDDSVLGFRVRVLAEVDEGGEAFRLTRVESTLLCARGLSEGICV